MNKLTCPKCNNDLITDDRTQIAYCLECDYVEDYPPKEIRR